MASWYDIQDDFHRSGDNWFRKFVKGLNNALNPYHAWFDYDEWDREGSGVEKLVNSVTDKYAGTGLTTAEQEANAFNAEEAQKSRDFTEYMARNKYQMESESMQAAGVNPALVYGGGNLVSTASNGAQASSVSPNTLNLFDALSTMISLPKQLKMMEADIANRKAEREERIANADLIRQKTETEKFITQLRGIDAKYADELTAQQLQNLGATYDNIVADTGMKKSSKERIDTEKKAQDILNQYLDERQRVEIDKIKSEKGEIDAKAAYERAQKVYQDWYNNFVKSNDFLPSTNDYLMLGTYIASIFGISKDQVEQFIEENNTNVQNWLSKYKSKNDPSSNNH